MNTQLTWLIPQRVLYAARSGQESLADLEAFIQQVEAYLADDGRPPVHLLWNMSGLDVTGVDRREAMTLLTRLMKHEKVKWFVVVDQQMPKLQRFLAAVVLRFSGIYWRTVDSQTAGLVFLHQVDTTLPPS